MSQEGVDVRQDHWCIIKGTKVLAKVVELGWALGRGLQAPDIAPSARPTGLVMAPRAGPYGLFIRRWG
ncbi:unnamed protein product [Lupinus luteus]|uniref:Uncharacterized protein n=1 Tax=Lupinus luteus TaxID=3873 RepID=A0AAV1Y3C0_LUPLU